MEEKEENPIYRLDYTESTGGSRSKDVWSGHLEEFIGFLREHRGVATIKVSLKERKE
jgi:hypothetical protein